MSDTKANHIEIAKKVWKLYQNGIDKSAISKELGINRAEVTHIIKYTTSTLFFSDNDFDVLIHTLIKENETLSKGLSKWQYSSEDAYRNDEKTGKKITYKRLSEIYQKKNETLKKELSDVNQKNKKFKKLYWVFFTIITLLSFLTGAYVKEYFIELQNYHQIDTSLSWKNQEGNTLYRLLKSE